MRELFSALVLFAAAVLLAAAFAGVGFVIYPTSALWLSVNLCLVGVLIAVLAAAATVWITIAAMGGRRHPLFDGLAVMLVLGLGACAAALGLAPGDYRAFLIEIVWTGFGRALAAVIPAWTVAWYALRQNRLLRGIAPEHKTTALADWLNQRP